ncbi:MAG: FAD-dependent thymidylate synthase [Tissierellia bacterium]|nr:FAD-dependent thymidylate synthase [Tissierellia bacterium]
MNIVAQSVELLTKTPYEEALRLVEDAGRTCYKSHRDTTVLEAEKFVKGIIKSGHESVVEHFNISFKIITDRGVTHQIVRHRIASFSQESTRYCNYSKDKFDNEITFIDPFESVDSEGRKEWEEAVKVCEEKYMQMIEKGVSLDIARSVLPNCTKTEIVMTANVREWRHFLKLRCDKATHYQTREIANMIRDELATKYPAFFEDLL